MRRAEGKSATPQYQYSVLPAVHRIQGMSESGAITTSELESSEVFAAHLASIA
jgi:hypothetical protein